MKIKKNKIIFFFAGIIAIMIGVIVMGGTFFSQTSYSPPDRPAGVPEDAVWVGGPDGGDWIQCKKKRDRLFECQIFSDVKGFKISRGNYYFDGNFENIDLNYRFHDGQIIQLKEGKLVPVGKHVHYHGSNQNESWVVNHPDAPTKK
ncbi:hypothetical protein D1BOALGB6SA_8228 [Olavius sp. associated proteobacterium Delta 1]|nr:hypothetical protein D1BOALGB6SA_8228 [Olavius sp. associated proteobacterium Delta 1]